MLRNNVPTDILVNYRATDNLEKVGIELVGHSPGQQSLPHVRGNVEEAALGRSDSNPLEQFMVQQWQLHHNPQLSNQLP